MFGVLINSFCTTASALYNLNRNNVPTTPQPTTEPTSKWRTLRALLFSTLSTFGLPFLRTIAGNTPVYEYVNAFLATSTSHNVEHRRQRRNGDRINRLSRPHFRRQSRTGGVVRIIKPTIHIVVHRD